MLAAGDSAKVKLLLNKGADVNAVSESGNTALITAAGYAGAANAINLLLEKGAGPKARDNFGNPVLIWANDIDNPIIFKMLLAKGAEVNVSNKDGYTPLMWASLAETGNPERVKALLDKGAEVNSKAKNQISVTDTASGCSWFVETRAIPFQRYFESGFPPGKRQWISAAGTS